MSDIKWFSGPPPAIGWWPTGFNTYRWWNGLCWSWGVANYENMWEAQRRSQIPSQFEGMKWRNWNIHFDFTDGTGCHL